MPINGFNVGRDYTFALYDNNTNQIVDLGDIQTFSAQAGKHAVKSMPYNNVPKFGYIPDGYSGNFTIVRTNAQLDNLAILLKNNFNAGLVMQPGFINETITNPDGSVSRYQYTGVVFFLDTPASGSREKVIDQRVEFMASDKLVIA